MPGSRRADGYRFEFLPEVAEETKQLAEDVRRAIAGIVVELHHNPYLGELMDDRWPRNLEGSRKVRFDVPGWHGKPRYRLVYRNEPTDGAVSVLVLAIARRDNMIAYAKAAARLARRAAGEQRTRRRRLPPRSPE